MRDEIRGKKETISMKQQQIRAETKKNCKSVNRQLFSLLFYFFIVLLCSAIALPAYASQGGEILGQKGDTSPGKQEAAATVMDKAGNVIVTGYSDPSGSNKNYYTVKFNSSGNGVLWAATYDSGQEDRATAIAVDSNLPDNNVIVTGYVWNGTNNDIYTMKYNGADGTPAAGWATPRIYNGTANGNDVATSIAVDSFNNVYVGGYTQTLNGDDYVIIKYTSGGTLDTTFNPGGTAPAMPGVVTYNGSANGTDWLLSIYVLSTGGSPGVAVTGHSWNGSNFDCTTLKYNYSTGAKIWEYVDSMPGDNRGKIVHMDSAGNVIMTGYIPNDTEKPTDKDMHVLKLDKAEDTAYPGQKKGKFLWGNVHAGGFSDDEPTALFIDTSDNVYMAGNKFSLNTSNDFYIVKYNSEGIVQWGAELNTTAGNDEVPTGITVNNDAEVLVTGYTREAISSNYDFLTAKYSSNGDLLWSKTFNNTANLNERPVGLSSSTGAAYVAGWTETSSNNYDYYAIKYDSGTLNRPTYLDAKASKPGATWQVNLTWRDNSILTNNENGFCIERCEGTGCDFSTKTTFTAGQNATSYLDSPVVEDKIYRYRAYSYYSGNCTTGSYSFRSDEFNTIKGGIAETSTYALNTSDPTWVYTYDSTDHFNDEAASISAGPDNNPVVTGTSDLDTSGTGTDYYTIKLNRATAIPIWKINYDHNLNAQEDQAASVSVDNDNNVVVSGSGQTGGSEWDIFTFAYLGAGSAAYTAWSIGETYKGNVNNYEDYVAATAIDSSVIIPPSTLSNKVAVAGFGAYDNSGRIDNDIFVILYPNCTAGDAPCPKIWAKVIDGGYGDDRSAGVIFDSAGDIYIAGQVRKSANLDFYTAKLSKTNGNIIWSVTFNGEGNGDDAAKSIDIGPSGNIYVTGYTTNASLKKDFYTVKYNSQNGAVIWEKTYGGSATYDSEAVSVKVDPINDQIDDGIVVAGTTKTQDGNKDFYVIRYTETAGGISWERQILRPSIDDSAVAMAIDPSGDVCIAGDTGTPPDVDILAIKLPYTGEIKSGWATKYIGALNIDVAKAVAANDFNEMFVAGTTKNISNNEDYVVFKCLGDSVVVPTPFTLTQVAGSASNNQGINLGWNGSMLTSPTFTLKRKDITGGGSWVNLLTGSTSTTYNDTGLTANNKYCYSLVARSGGVDSRELGKCRTTTMIPPSLGSLTVTSTSQIIVSWTNITGNLGYRLERKRTSTGPWGIIGTDPLAVDQAGYPDSGLEAGIAYFYRLSVYNIGGLSLTSAEMNKATVPPAPGLNTPGSITTQSMSLSWTTTADDPGTTSDNKTYTLQYKIAGGSYADVTGCVDITSTSCATGNILTPGSQYYFMVKAKNSSSSIWSVWSNVVDGWTLPPTPTLTNVTRAADCSNSTATIYWNDVSGETGYYVEYNYCYDSNTDPTHCATTSGYWQGWQSAGSPGANSTNTTYDMTAGYAYRFRVSSTVNSGSTRSAVSNEGSVWACMPALTQNAVTPVSETSLQVNWTDITGNTNYDVQRRDCSGNCVGNSCTASVDYRTVAGSTGLSANLESWTSGSLTQGASYAYKVRAYNTTGFAGLTPPPEVFSGERCLATPPPAPNTVTLTDVQANQITVDWQNQGGGQYTGYVIERSTNSGDNPGTDGTSGWGAFSALTGVVQNPDFELGTPPSTITNWTTAVGTTTGATLDTTVFKNGARSLKIYQITTGTTATIGRLQAVTVLPGKQYVLSGWVNASITQGAVQCDVQGTGIDSAGLYINVASSNNNAGWVFLTETVTIPSATTSVNIRCFGDSTPRGTVYFDHIHLLMDPAITTYTNTGLTAGYGYKYQMRGTYNDANGYLAYTAYTSAPYTRTIPTTPSFTSIVADSTSQITVNWSNPTGNTGFALEWKLKDGSTCADGSPVWTTVDRTWNTYTYVHPAGLPEGRTFCYQIRSYTDTREGATPTIVRKYSAYSAASTRMTLLSPPVASSITLTVNSSTQITINWGDVANNTGYMIERSTDGTNFSQIGTTLTSDADYIDNTGLSAGTLYYYRIYTKNGDGNYSVASTVKSTTTTPAAPASLGLNVISESRIDISWQVSLGATKYKVEGTTGAGGAWENVGSELSVAYQELYCGYYSLPTVGCTLIPKYTSTSSTKDALGNNLEKNREYCYKVTAWNPTGGYSGPSSTVCAKTASMSAPVLESVTAPTSRQIDVVWSYSPSSCSPDPCEPADGFEVEAKMKKWHWMNRASVPGSSATTYSDKAGIMPEITYTYRVRAYKLAYNDTFTTMINPVDWTTAINPATPNGNDSASAIWLNGAVRLNTSAAASGSGTNYSRIYLKKPDILSGDFDVQVDYSLPSQTTASKYDIYARMVLQFKPLETGNIYYILAERSIDNQGGSYQNMYKGTLIIGSTTISDGYIPTSDTSGKLRITKSGNTMTMYAWTNGEWYVLNSVKDQAFLSTPIDLKLTQNVVQGQLVTMTADLDNFMIYTKSPYSNEKSATTPAWQLIHDQCN